MGGIVAQAVGNGEWGMRMGVCKWFCKFWLLGWWFCGALLVVSRYYQGAVEVLCFIWIVIYEEDCLYDVSFSAFAGDVYFAGDE